MDRRQLLYGLLGSTSLALAGCVAGDAGAGTTAQTTRTDARPTTTIMTDEPETTDRTDTATDDAGLVTVQGGEDVPTTVDRITEDVAASPLTLVTTVDHAKNAADAGLDLPPTMLLIFGNPEVGTPLMQASRTVAVDLPQRMLVWEDDDGTVRVTYNDPEYLANRHGIDDQDDRLDTVASVLRRIATGEE
jgi:uncharacterized protein (DUF302 family)